VKWCFTFNGIKGVVGLHVSFSIKVRWGFTYYAVVHSSVPSSGSSSSAIAATAASHLDSGCCCRYSATRSPRSNRGVQVVPVLHIFDGLLDDLLKPRAVDKEAVGIAEQTGLRYHLLDSVIGELALDEADQLVRGP
jgi:hypothetical protein